MIKNPVETWTLKKCETSLHNEEKGRARHSMCERQDENAMKNKFQFNWTATKVQACKDLRNGGLKVVFSVQWETYCRIINVSDYKMIETRLSQNLKRTAPRPLVVVMAKFDSVKDV